ncbi:MAG: phospholipid carrier-dependent glycosyltransferase [Dehalococcoidia bacterium]|nr:phospholipid carrier-dependent glycosyltransferase [Dehalococcoidia bacterium]
MNWRVKVALWSTVGITAVFRFHALFANTYHADEALFATWARFIATWRDPLLLTQAVDKPPLLFYLQALFYLYPVLGPTEIAARLPNFIASILLVPLVGVWAWRLYGDEVTAVLAALLLALSPFAIQFSATAFTDPLLTFWLVAAFVAATKMAPHHRKTVQEQVGTTPGAGRNDPGASRNGSGASRNGSGASRNGSGADRNDPGASRNDPGASRNGSGEGRNDPGASRNDPGASRERLRRRFWPLLLQFSGGGQISGVVVLAAAAGIGLAARLAAARVGAFCFGTAAGVGLAAGLGCGAGGRPRALVGADG